MLRPLIVTSVLLLAGAPPATHAQSLGAAEFSAGWAGFVDESLINHGVVGGSVRFHLTPRLSIGPELVYMRGPGDDRDLFLTGNLTFDFLARPAGSRTGLVTPFVVAGGGLMSHSTRFGPTSFTSNEGAFTAGGGARGWVTDRVYLFGEFRGGWEPHMRVSGGGGIGF